VVTQKSFADQQVQGCCNNINTTGVNVMILTSS